MLLIFLFFLFYALRKSFVPFDIAKIRRVFFARNIFRVFHFSCMRHRPLFATKGSNTLEMCRKGYDRARGESQNENAGYQSLLDCSQHFLYIRCILELPISSKNQRLIHHYHGDTFSPKSCRMWVSMMWKLGSTIPPWPWPSIS